MNETQLDRLAACQAVGMTLLERWDLTCRAHGLSYHLGGGTLLGAVRSQGFIPWDDDVDVSMRRAEFRRLHQLSQADPTLFGDGFTFNDGSTEAEAGRLVYEPSSAREGQLHLDVFVLDDVPRNRLLADLLARAAWALRLGLSVTREHPYVRPDDRRTAGRIGRITRFVGRERVRKTYRLVVRLGATLSDGTMCNCLNGSRPWGRERPTAWYEGSRTARFEGVEYPIPTGAEAVLALVYGADFRTPHTEPPLPHWHAPLWARVGEREWHVA